jgi:hypothetical protein
MNMCIRVGVRMTEIKDELTKKELKTELIARSSNCCCVCQTPFIHAHHMDFNNENDTFDNLAPLCPNHHSLAHTRSNMFLNLTPERIKTIRNKWYEYVENRKQNLDRGSGLAKLMIKNFDRFLGPFGATHGWAKTFASLDEEYGKMKKDEIIDRVFSSSNPTELKIYLETIKHMYADALKNEKIEGMFRTVCNAFGFDYDGKNVV